MRVVVIGAGFAGLAAGEALARGGADVTVCEARDRVGGRVWSAPFGDGVVERGAEFVLPGNDAVHGVAARLGLRLFEKGTTYGRRRPAGELPLAPAAFEQAVARLAGARPRDLDGLTLDVALERLVEDDGARAAIAARLEVSSAQPATDLDASVLAEAGAGFGDFVSHGVEGGNMRIAERLAAGLDVRLGLPARRVVWGDPAVRVAVDDGELEADAAVVALPASVTDGVAFDPPLPAWKRDALGAVRYGQAAKLFLELEAPAGPSAVLAVADRFWCWTQLDAAGAPRRVLSAFAGTPAAVERLAADGGRAWAARIGELRPDLALVDRPPLLSTWHDDPWALGAYSARAYESPLDDERLAATVGPIAFAGEHTAGPSHALMDGALRSGARAAADLLARADSPLRQA